MFSAALSPSHVLNHEQVFSKNDGEMLLIQLSHPDEPEMVTIHLSKLEELTHFNNNIHQKSSQIQSEKKERHEKQTEDDNSNQMSNLHGKCCAENSGNSTDRNEKINRKSPTSVIPESNRSISRRRQRSVKRTADSKKIGHGAPMSNSNSRSSRQFSFRSLNTSIHSPTTCSFQNNATKKIEAHTTLNRSSSSGPILRRISSSIHRRRSKSNNTVTTTSSSPTTTLKSKLTRSDNRKKNCAKTDLPDNGSVTNSSSSVYPFSSSHSVNIPVVSSASSSQSVATKDHNNRSPILVDNRIQHDCTNLKDHQQQEQERLSTRLECNTSKANKENNSNIENDPMHPIPLRKKKGKKNFNEVEHSIEFSRKQEDDFEQQINFLGAPAQEQWSLGSLRDLESCMDSFDDQFEESKGKSSEKEQHAHYQYNYDDSCIWKVAQGLCI